MSHLLIFSKPTLLASLAIFYHQTFLETFKGCVRHPNITQNRTTTLYNFKRQWSHQTSKKEEAEKFAEKQRVPQKEERTTIISLQQQQLCYKTCTLKQCIIFIDYQSNVFFYHYRVIPIMYIIQIDTFKARVQTVKVSQFAHQMVFGRLPSSTDFDQCHI